MSIDNIEDLEIEARDWISEILNNSRTSGTISVFAVYFLTIGAVLAAYLIYETIVSLQLKKTARYQQYNSNKYAQRSGLIGSADGAGAADELAIGYTNGRRREGGIGSQIKQAAYRTFAEPENINMLFGWMRKAYDMYAN